MNVVETGQTWEYAANVRGGTVRFRIDRILLVYAEVTFLHGRQGTGTIALSLLRRGKRSAKRVQATA